MSEVQRNEWPAAVSDGLTLPCGDCGKVPRFDYRVEVSFWRYWVPEKDKRIGVICLPCLDRRCGGVGLAGALIEVQWTGIGHTVVLVPTFRHVYTPAGKLFERASEQPAETEEEGG